MVAAEPRRRLDPHAGAQSRAGQRGDTTWDFKVDPVRREPDPALLEQFVAVQLSEEARDKLLRWGK
jgi:hypothetical protein